MRGIPPLMRSPVREIIPPIDRDAAGLDALGKDQWLKPTAGNEAWGPYQWEPRGTIDLWPSARWNEVRPLPRGARQNSLSWRQAVFFFFYREGGGLSGHFRVPAWVPTNSLTWVVILTAKNFPLSQNGWKIFRGSSASGPTHPPKTLPPRGRHFD
jgi:hypothetical protein